MARAVVVFSGGLDSTTALYKAIADGYEAHAVSFDYGQKHRKELEQAAKIARGLGVDHRVVDITAITGLISNSALTSDKEVPEGHYAADNMKATVVPNRNMIMASIAIGYAVNVDAKAVYLGVHGGDHFIYPDCRPEFVRLLVSIALVANEGFIDPGFEIITPFLNSSKADIVREGAALGAPLELTWSCYKGGARHCGRCGTCVERKEAFLLAGLADPTSYEA
ncbi:MAG: 7-cyano-7-deazaguanine synthase QueC [Chloroflexi bacterium]|nr:7-cyano-7-deazaguanine synthase QueC [Chloroflexota bacterium]